MLTIQAPLKQPSFFDNEVNRALQSNELLSKIDDLLDEILELLAPFIKKYKEDREKRCVSADIGKPTASIESIVRLILLKHLHTNCSYRDVETRTKTDLAWKGFAKLRFADPVPDYSTLAKWVTFFGEGTISELHDQIIDHLRKKKIIKGRKLRTDTTVAKANIHYPTDVSLLGDAIRVITQTVKKIKKVVKLKTVFRPRMKRVKVKIYELNHSLSKRTGEAKESIKKVTRELARMATAVAEKAESISNELEGMSQEAASCLHGELDKYIEICKKLVDQTEVRLNGGKLTNRIVSVFQPSMRPIKKGKRSVSCEFGKKLEIDEVEHGIISDWQVYEGNPGDSDLLIPCVDRHNDRFGRDPTEISTDRGFASEDNEDKLKGRVKRISIPQRGKKTKRRQRTERSRWFQTQQRWRAGGEAKISWLKRSFECGQNKAKTEEGYDQAIGWSIVGCNLKVVARLT